MVPASPGGMASVLRTNPPLSHLHVSTERVGEFHLTKYTGFAIVETPIRATGTTSSGVVPTVTGPPALLSMEN